MNYQVEYSLQARQDIARLVAHLSVRDEQAAQKALLAIRNGLKIFEMFPFSTRAAEGGNPLIRELVINFGASGYVALFAIRGEYVTILAVRHQFEDDFF